jgi:hypothetical protein
MGDALRRNGESSTGRNLVGLPGYDKKTHGAIDTGDGDAKKLRCQNSSLWM